MAVLRFSLALAAALTMGAPALGSPMRSFDLIVVCTAHGADLLAIPRDGEPAEERGRHMACHAACPSPMQARADRKARS